MAAAASSLKSQAGDLVQTVAVFKLSATDQGQPVRAAAAPTPRAASAAPGARGGVSNPAAAKPLAAPTKAPAPPKPAALRAEPQLAPVVAKTNTKVTPAGGDDDWETF
ncbi:hypothetical protein CHU94_00010 [Rhodoferax sp. TH121]|nr:hypothetical protein CHU94_00010 [Rhodoferax sp. TH121]